MKPETRLMMALFGGRMEGKDEDFLDSVEGVTLSDALYNLLHAIQEETKVSRPIFAKRVLPLIEGRFGFKDKQGKGKTLEQLAQEFGVTKERIRQHEILALRMLRHPQRSQLLKSYIRKERR